jgi:SNF2 family DNA or RNA helicase|tara:strand:- start:3789 stop:5225 length:1437 start_codon:yes stop_codon:yes gene_type:complete
MRYKFKYTPYAHQLEALKNSWNKEEFALFMDMGTGKSKVLIDNISILYDQGKIEGALIVAPKGVYRNWERAELPTHLPDHIISDIVLWNPSQTKTQIEKQQSLFHTSDNLKIFLMNIEAFSTKKGYEIAQKFLTYNTCCMAIDESTTIKSKSAKRTKNIIKLGKLARYRRILTGSPVTKSPMDLYTQCEFLSPFILGHSSFYSFQNHYAIIQRRNVGSHSFNHVMGYRNLSELTEKLKEYSFRILKEECLDLPDKVYTKRMVELTDEQKIVYDNLKKYALALIEEGSITPSTMLTQILRLQQICSGHVKLDDGELKHFKTNKLVELDNVTDEIRGKVIIWANFTQDIKSIVKLLHDKYGPDSVVSYYGETPSEVRQEIVEEFQDLQSRVRFFVGQPRTGGYGLTLTSARTVIYYSNGYDLEVRLQSEDRAHRIGQVNKVTYIDIITEKTVDEKILKALRSKIDISSQVLSEDYKQWII